jgi:cell filamentation protein
MLRKKLGIDDPVALAHEEERISKAAALAMYGDGTFDTLVPGSFAALRKIHVCLFGKIYARGIDASYAYEGYAAFRAEDLID